MINHMEIKSVFKTYKVDFTNRYQIEPSHNDVLVIDRKVMDIYGSRYNAFLMYFILMQMKKLRTCQVF